MIKSHIAGGGGEGGGGGGGGEEIEMLTETELYYLPLYTTGHGWGVFSYLHVNWNILQGCYIFTYCLEHIALFDVCRE